MCLEYADDELQKSLVPANGPGLENQNIGIMKPRPKFKYVDGIQRLADLPFPCLVDLPNGSS